MEGNSGVRLRGGSKQRSQTPLWKETTESDSAVERKQKSPTLQWNGNNRVRLCSGKETKESDSTVEGNNKVRLLGEKETMESNSVVKRKQLSLTPKWKGNNKVRLPGGKETTESDYAGGKEKTKSNSKVEHDMTTQSKSAWQAGPRMHSQSPRVTAKNYMGDWQF